MSQKSSLQRVLEILNRLNKGEKLCVSQLAEHYEVSDRSIQRDFKIILEVFDDFLIKDGECYKGYKKVLLDELLQGSELMMLSNIVNVFDITDTKSLVSSETKKLIQNSMNVYAFKSKPFEILKQTDELRKLEQAIRQNKEIVLVYERENEIFNFIVNPYKIIFLNENFYLVAKDINDDNILRLRIALIKSVTLSSKTFYPEPKIIDHINTLQTPWKQFNKKDITIKLLVKHRVAHYFLLKKYLPSQKVLQEYDNGDIEVAYQVTNFKEIEELIIKWIPKIEIIEPKELQSFIKKELLSKLNKLL
jgi:predicted DNA-binding transcriptional regulator YafY